MEVGRSGKGCIFGAGARPGCGTPATATLRFQPTLRQAWLVDLDESAARTQGDLCRLHAAASASPRGWELHDSAPAGRVLVDEPTAETAGTAAPRRVRVRRRAPAPETEPAPSPLPGFEPVVVTNGDAPVVAADDEHAAEPPADAPDKGVAPRGTRGFGANDVDDAEVDDDALDTILDARTPLLQRGFRNAKPESDPADS